MKPLNIGIACLLSAAIVLPANSQKLSAGSPGHSGLYFGVEATYLAPLYDEAPTSFTVFDDATLGTPSATTGSSFDGANDLTGAPRITLGYNGKRGFGLQFRYWELDSYTSSSNFVAPIILNPQIQELGGEDRFNAYTIDLELTKDFCFKDWNLLGTFGVRHASLDHSRVSNAVGGVNGSLFSMQSRQGEAFDGTGLTFSLSGLKTIRPCQGLGLYWTTRASTVFGSADTTAITSVSRGGEGSFSGSTNGAIDETDDTMFIGELGAGLQWSRCVKSYKGRMFARIGVEYQYWGTGGGNALAVSGAGVLGSSSGFAVATGGSHEFDLIGLTAATGFAW